MKKCNTCKLMKPFDMYTVNKYSKNVHYHNDCKDCIQLKRKWKNILNKK